MTAKKFESGYSKVQKKKRRVEFLLNHRKGLWINL